MFGVVGYPLCGQLGYFDRKGSRGVWVLRTSRLRALIFLSEIFRRMWEPRIPQSKGCPVLSEFRRQQVGVNFAFVRAHCVHGWWALDQGRIWPYGVSDVYSFCCQASWGCTGNFICFVLQFLAVRLQGSQAQATQRVRFQMRTASCLFVFSTHSFPVNQLP